MNWFKMYIDGLMDPDGTLASLTDEQLGVWCRLLGLAGHINEGGRFTVNGVELTVQQVERASRCQRGNLSKNMALFVKIALLEKKGETIFIKNWVVYQDAWEREKLRRNSRNKTSQKNRTVKPHSNAVKKSFIVDVDVDLDVDVDKKKKSHGENQLLEVAEKNRIEVNKLAEGIAKTKHF